MNHGHRVRCRGLRLLRRLSKIHSDFLPTPVPDEAIEEIIAAGLTSPSWSNTRPFVVAVAKGDVRDRLSAEFLRRFEMVKTGRARVFWGS